MPFVLRFSVAVVLGATLVGAGCSSLEGSGHACRHDDDCKGHRICGANALCIDPKDARPDSSTSEGAHTASPDEPSSEAVDEVTPEGMTGPEGMTAPEDTAGASNGIDGSAQENPDAGTQGGMAETVAPCVPEAGCYELVIDSEICPGLEWQMSDKLWGCDAMTFMHDGSPYVARWLHFFSAAWAGTKSDVAWGPTLTFAEQSVVEVSLSHRFDRYGVNPVATLKLVADGADPHESGVELWKARAGAQRESVSEKAQIKMSDLPEELRAQARIVLLAGGTERRNTVAPMSWELIHLRVEAK